MSGSRSLVATAWSLSRAERMPWLLVTWKEGIGREGESVEVRGL